MCFLSFSKGSILTPFNREKEFHPYCLFCSSDYRRSLRTDEDSSDRLSKLVDVQLDLVSSVFDRELYMLKFLAANPGAAVVQELGYSSLRRTLKYLRQTFTPVAYSVLSALLDSLAQTEEGAFRCLLTVPEEMEEEIVRRVQGRSHVYHAPEVVRSCARMYRETAEEFDAVWNPEEENVKMNLTAVVERFE